MREHPFPRRTPALGLGLGLALSAAAGCATAPAGPPAAPPGAREALAEAKRLSVRARILDFSEPPAGWTGEGVAVSGGALTLAAGASAGSFLSPRYAMPSFDWLVPSWDIAAPGGSSVEVFVRVRVKGAWSDWYAFGRWSGRPGSAEKSSDALGRVEIDTLLLYGAADAVGIRLDLAAGPEGAAPSVRSLSWAARDRFAAALPEPSPPAYPETSLAVPARSQMVEDPGIASRICGPTSLSMVLAALGTELPTAKVAEAAYDAGAGIFGNWSFNTSLASSLGHRARVDWYSSLAELAEQLKLGFPVVASVSYKKGELANAAIPATPGHLLVVRGMAKRGEDWYVLVNDPAAEGPEGVPREYLAKQFKNAWNGVVYVIAK
ncbi:MAG: C39 family peptidase [Spirochaetaceae bacterium]|nr:C39 family peptidase [Spirochaetaceae bacterium]